MAARIPLTVIGGFLGAGKTTLVNRLLAEAGGRRIAVLVNDFGALDIDAALVANSAGDTMALSNGCVCCSIGDDLAAALLRVLEASPRFDAVVIEASGVSDPWRIAQIGLAEPALELGGVVVLVDASAVLGQSRDPLLADTLLRQLRAADLLVLNKTDRVPASELQRLRDRLDALLPATPRHETSQADVPAALLEAPRLPTPPAEAACGCGAPHNCDGHRARHPAHAEQFETWSAQPEATLSASALRAVLRAMPPGVLRLKGLVRTDEHGWSEWQYAGRHGSLRRALATPAGGAAVVAIGLRGQLPRAALDALLAGTRCAA